MVEALEDRTLFSVGTPSVPSLALAHRPVLVQPLDIVPWFVPNQTVRPGQKDVLAAALCVSTARQKIEIGGFSFTASGQDGLKNVASAYLSLDKNLNGIRDRGDVLVARATPSRGLLTFKTRLFQPAWRSHSYVVTIDVAKKTTGFTTGLRSKDMSVRTSPFSSYRAIRTDNGFAAVHRIEAPEVLPQYYVTQRSLSRADTVVSNAKNVNLLRFDVGSFGGDSLLTSARFTAAAGSPYNFTNYTLWGDTDDNGIVDTILESGVTPNQGIITFDDIVGGGYVTENGNVDLFEVHADVAGSMVSSSFQLAIDASSPFGAETVSRGTPLPGGNIHVSRSDSTRFTLVKQGNLFVTRDITTLRPRQLLGGTVGEPVLRLNLRAEHESIDVTTLRFTTMGGTAESVERLELYRDGDTFPFATATLAPAYESVPATDPAGNPARTFVARMPSQQLVAWKDRDVKVIVVPRMKADIDGARSGDPVQLFVHGEALASNVLGQGAVRARGYDSSNDLAANDGDALTEGEIFIGTASVGPNNHVVGNANVTVLSKITTITNGSSDAPGTSVPTGIADIGVFKFGAAWHQNDRGANAAVLSDVIFNVTASNVALDASSFRLHNKADSTIRTNGIVLNLDGTPYSGSVATGSFLVRFDSLDMSSVNTRLDRGAGAILVVSANVLSPVVRPGIASALQVSLTNFTKPGLPFGATGSHLVWRDTGFGPDASSSAFFWVDYPETIVKSTTYVN